MNKLLLHSQVNLAYEKGVFIMHKCKVIAVTNQKGGVGKTTTTENVTIGLARNGCNVLIVDFDPQGDLTSCLGWKNNDSLEHSVSSMLDDGTYYSRKVGDDKVTKHVVKDGKAVLSDAIYGHEYEFKGIKAPTSYQLADKSKAYKVESDEETDTIIYYFENARIVVPNTGV